MENKTDIIIGTSKEILPCNENVDKATPWQNNDDIKYKEKKGSNTIDGENEKDLCISSDDYTKTIKNVKDLDFVDETKAGNKEHIALENEPKPFPGGKTDEKICMYIQKNFVAEEFSDKRSKERHMSISCPKLPKNNSVVQHFKTHKGGWPYAYLFKKGNEIKTKQFIDKDFQLHTTDQTFCTSIKDVDMLIKDSENTCSAQSDEETHSEEWQVVGFTTHDSEMINDNAVYDHFKLKDMKMHNKESDLLVQTNEEMYTRKPEPVSSVSTKR
ncbi:unnamed protein product [Mytilus coruscus]|uniref:Uncharacterized protein n=1 Tax=Mytilus coruscus TaxID=42192 RepID=A0A6J8BAH1_MYTCO|nr:unnamed protein product [Mytilus coruscus]